MYIQNGQLAVLKNMGNSSQYAKTYVRKIEVETIKFYQPNNCRLIDRIFRIMPIDEPGPSQLF